MLIAATGLALANTAGVAEPGDRGPLRARGPRRRREPRRACLPRSARRRGIKSAEAVPESEMRKTLEKWLGPAGAKPGPAGPGADQFRRREPGADLRSIQQQAEAIAPGARVVAHRDSVGPLLRSLRVLQVVAFGLVLLLERRRRGGGRARRARRARHPSLHDRGHARHRRDRPPGHASVPAQDRDRRADRQPRAARVAAALVLLLLAGGAAFAGELTGGATLGRRAICWSSRCCRSR